MANAPLQAGATRGIHPGANEAALFRRGWMRTGKLSPYRGVNTPMDNRTSTTESTHLSDANPMSIEAVRDHGPTAPCPRHAASTAVAFP